MEPDLNKSAAPVTDAGNPEAVDAVAAEGQAPSTEKPTQASEVDVSSPPLVIPKSLDHVLHRFASDDGGRLSAKDAMFAVAVWASENHAQATQSRLDHLSEVEKSRVLGQQLSDEKVKNARLESEEKERRKTRPFAILSGILGVVLIDVGFSFMKEAPQLHGSIVVVVGFMLVAIGIYLEFTK